MCDENTELLKILEDNSMDSEKESCSSSAKNETILIVSEPNQIKEEDISEYEIDSIEEYEIDSIEEYEVDSIEEYEICDPSDPLDIKNVKNLDAELSADATSQIILVDKQTKKERLKCMECSRVLTKRSHYIAHCRRHRAKKKCDICQKIFETEAQTKEHMKTEHCKNTNCEKCGKSFPSVANFENHKARFQDLPTCNFTCGNCVESFFTREHLRRHIESLCVYKCEKCSKQFKTLKGLNFHIEYNKEDCSLKKCFYCCNIIDKKEFDEHVIIHQNHSCKICKKSFENGSQFTSHECNIEIVICEHCGKEFQNINLLKKHISKTCHEGTPKYICERCTRPFWQLSKLQVHLKQHDNIKDFACDQCDKKFVTRGRLNFHVRVVHLNIRLHKCKECGKKFARKVHLRKHSMIHLKKGKKKRIGILGVNKVLEDQPVESTDEPCKCQYCDKDLENVASLICHINNEHVRL